LARHETVSAIMNSIVGWAAGVTGIAFFLPNQSLTIGAIFTAIFWIVVPMYFYLDFRSRHKKDTQKPKVTFPPLTSETPIKTVESIETLSTVNKIIKAFFTGLEAFESFAFVAGSIFAWQIFTINNVPVLTYTNSIQIALISLGIVLGIDVIRRLWHSRKFFKEY
jgi:uncharacterized membrane protein